MAERRRVGVFYHYNDGWIGGVYYVQNLIAALGKLADAKQPEIFTICSDKKAFEDLKRNTGYRYLYYLPSLPSYNLLKTVINKISRLLFKKNVFDHLRNKVDCFFPVNGIELNYGKTKNIFWVPDFQEAYFPEFFPKEELAALQSWRTKISSTKDALLVLSSNTALSDYRRFYPDAVTKNVVIPFAVHHNLSDLPKIDNLLIKYHLPPVYFIAPNQFWKHKNHQIILSATRLLKAKGIATHIVFTGKEYDHRNPEYVTELKQYVQKEELKSYISFLGFIDRQDQLQLMKHSIAIIQPSRFEGWSTVIEDAKSLNHLVLASSIDVHKEQLGIGGYYFDTDKPEELVILIEKVLFHKLKTRFFNYTHSQMSFAENFYKLITKDV